MTRPIVIAQRGIAWNDPHDCTDNADILSLYDGVFDALVRRGRDGGYVPALAQSWEISEDARRWTFTLRTDIAFHDGRPITSADAHASIERMMRPEIGATLGAPAVWGQYLIGAEVDTPDPTTVRVTTAEPLADLLDVLVSGYILPEEQIGGTALPPVPIGSGAYRVVSRDGDTSMTLEANPNWWGGLLANQSLEILGLPDESDRIAAIRDGGADIATKLGPAAGALASLPGLMVREHVDPTAILYLLTCSRGPFQDSRVRRAISLAVDRQAIIDTVIGGAGTPLPGFVSQVHFGAVSAEAPDRTDLETARALLTEAGYGDGLRLVVDCPTSLPSEAQALTACLADQLAAIGITIETRVETDRVLYAENVRGKKIGDMCVFDSSPLSTFRVLYEKIDSRQEGSWWQGYANPEVEALLDRARRTVDMGSREEIYREIYRMLQADPAWLTLYNHIQRVALRSSDAGWRMRSDGVLDLAALPKIDGVSAYSPPHTRRLETGRRCAAY